jgi:putative Mn2+ efflux pump MntP
MAANDYFFVILSPVSINGKTMMNILDILFLSVALAMDCFTVSIVSGVIMGRCFWRVVLRMSFFFGLFQAVMPLIGWFATNRFAKYIESVDHWAAFALLVFLGARMVRESFQPDDSQHFNPARLRTQLVLAVATSIDALAVGISLALIGYRTLHQLSFPLWAIGIGSFLFGITGQLLGVRFGGAIRHRLKPDLLGGAILIFIGIKILVSHLLGAEAL